MDSRRSFFQKAIAGAAAASLVPEIIQAAPSQLDASPIKLSISSYSYWHFKGPKFPIEKVIDEAAKLGVAGIDVLHRQMEGEDNIYLQKLK